MSALIDFTPQVIVYVGMAFYPKVLIPLEAEWASKTQAPRPVYLTESGNGTFAINFAGNDTAKRRRFFAVTNRTATTTNAKLVLRYNAAFPAEPVTEAEAPQPSYDAFYVAAYSVYALGDGDIDGIAISRSIGRLVPPGLRVEVGPAQIGEAFEVVRSGGQIDLNGAIGSLDFESKTGEATIDYAVVCPGVDDHGRASTDVDSHLFYDAREKKLVGKMACP